MDLSIIVLNYNTKDLTINCINSIVDQYKEELDKKKFEIVLVDNASSDGSLEAFRKIKLEGLRLIENGENLGFSKGCNLGARKSTGNFLLFLNSDTEIKDQGFIKMVQFFDDKKEIGILGGKLKNEDGTNQLSCGKFYSLFNLFLMLYGFNKLLRESPSIIKKVDWVSGACLMVRRNIFEKLGGFDRDIFMYLEDMDLCFKARKKGFFTYFFPEIMLFHKEGRSSNRSFAVLNIYKSVLIFYKKHKGGLEYLIAELMLKSKAFLLVVLGKIINNKYLQGTYGEALKI